MKIAIVTHFRVVSHFVVANRIRETLSGLGHECKVYDYEDARVEEENVLFVGTVFGANLSYLSRFVPERNLVFYGTVEGFPIMDPAGFEREIADKIKIVVPSHFVKMCLETIRLPVAGMVPHGLDMKNREYDKDYYEYLSHFMKGPVILYVAGNSERKGIDRFILACKLVSRVIPKAHFILHSGRGFVNIPKTIQDLEVKNFWYTNSFGMLPRDKMNSLYKICTVYSEASYCEGFGLGKLEAFRFEKPVIAVDAEPYSEIVDAKTGKLIPVKTVIQRKYMDRFLFPLHIYAVDDLADAIISIVRSKRKFDFEEAQKTFDASNTYPKLLEFF